MNSGQQTVVVDLGLGDRETGAGLVAGGLGVGGDGVQVTGQVSVGRRLIGLVWGE